jgi:hypothetical protein
MRPSDTAARHYTIASTRDRKPLVGTSQPAVQSGSPAITVLVVSDYGSWDDSGWDDLRQTLRALGAEALEADAEVVLVDSLPEGRPSPPDLKEVIPGLRVVGPSPSGSQELLNEAVRSASSDLVALLDGDCLPAPGWLRAATEVMRAHPEVAAASGRTLYPDTSLLNRVLGLLSRGFIDPGKAGPTRFVTSYNAVFRRDSLLAHPLQTMQRALAARMQTEAIRLDGGVLWFEPRMQATHRFEGWRMESRIRRNVGYRAVRVRQLDPRVPHAWMTRWGKLSIPLIVGARTLDSFRDCIRVGRFHGVRWFELPAAFAIAVGVHLLEIGGMAAALAEPPPAPR